MYQNDIDSVALDHPRLGACLQRVRDLYVDDKYADLQIAYKPNGSSDEARQREWKVHRAIVCPQSGFFAACIKASGRFVESQANRIVLQEIPGGSTVLDAILQFMYYCDYDDCDANDAGMTTMAFNINIIAAADFLRMEEWIFDLAEEKFQAAAEANWRTADFAAAVRLLYSDAFPHELMDLLITAVVRVVSENFSELWSNDGARTCAALGKVAAETPKFLSDVCRYKHFEGDPDLFDVTEAECPGEGVTEQERAGAS